MAREARCGSGSGRGGRRAAGEGAGGEGRSREAALRGGPPCHAAPGAAKNSRGGLVTAWYCGLLKRSRNGLLPAVPAPLGCVPLQLSGLLFLNQCSLLLPLLLPVHTKAELLSSKKALRQAVSQLQALETEQAPDTGSGSGGQRAGGKDAMLSGGGTGHGGQGSNGVGDPSSQSTSSQASAVAGAQPQQLTAQQMHQLHHPAPSAPSSGGAGGGGDMAGGLTVTERVQRIRERMHSLLNTVSTEQGRTGGGVCARRQ